MKYKEVWKFVSAVCLFGLYLMAIGFVIGGETGAILAAAGAAACIGAVGGGLGIGFGIVIGGFVGSLSGWIVGMGFIGYFVGWSVGLFVGPSVGWWTAKKKKTIDEDVDELQDSFSKKKASLAQVLKDLSRKIRFAEKHGNIDTRLFKHQLSNLRTRFNNIEPKDGISSIRNEINICKRLVYEAKVIRKKVDIEELFQDVSEKVEKLKFLNPKSYEYGKDLDRLYSEYQNFFSNDDRAYPIQNIARLNNIEKRTKDLLDQIQSEIDYERSRSQKLDEWIDSLDVYFEEITHNMRETLLPIYEQYKNLENDESIKEKMETITDDIDRLVKVSEQYEKLTKKDTEAGREANKLKDEVEYTIEGLKEEHSNLKELEKERKQHLDEIIDLSKTIILQYASGNDVSGDSAVKKIKMKEEEVHTSLREVLKRARDITRRVRVETGLEEAFTPEDYELVERKSQIESELQSLKEQEEMIDTRAIEKALKNYNMDRAEEQIEDLRDKYEDYQETLNELKSLDRRKTSLAEQLADGEIDRQTFNDARKAIENKKADLEGDLEQLRSEVIYEEYQKPF